MPVSTVRTELLSFRRPPGVVASKKNQLVRVSKSVARELRYTETILAVAYKLIHPEH